MSQEVWQKKEVARAGDLEKEAGVAEVVFRIQHVHTCFQLNLFIVFKRSN